MDCKLASVAPVSPSTVTQAQCVCIMHHAGFVMYYEVQDSKTHRVVATTSKYPTGVMNCTDLEAISGVQDADVFQMSVHAILGETKLVDRMV